MADDKTPVKTETVVRTFNAADDLLSEKVTVVTITTQDDDDTPLPGAFL